MHVTIPKKAPQHDEHRPAPRMNGRTEAAHETFLSLLADTGNVTLACQGSGMPRSQAYRLRAIYPAFAERWQTALNLGVAGLEDVARQRAMDGSEVLLMFLLRAYIPERYAQRATIDINSRLSASLREAPIEQLRAELAQLLSGIDPTSTQASQGLGQPDPKPLDSADACSHF